MPRQPADFSPELARRLLAYCVPDLTLARARQHLNHIGPFTCEAPPRPRGTGLAEPPRLSLEAKGPRPAGLAKSRLSAELALREAGSVGRELEGTSSDGVLSWRISQKHDGRLETHLRSPALELTGARVLLVLGTRSAPDDLVFRQVGDGVEATVTVSAEQMLKEPPGAELRLVLGDLRAIDVPLTRITACAISADGDTALMGNEDGSLLLWDLVSHEELSLFGGDVAKVECCALATSLERVALTGHCDGTLRLWDTETGEMVRLFEGHRGAVRDVAFDPAERLALSGSDDATLRLWSVETGEILRVLEARQAAIECCAFDSAGRRALSVSRDGVFQLWDLESGQTLKELRVDERPARPSALAGDGRLALSVHAETIQLWDLEVGRPLATRRDVGGRVAALVPDASRAIVAGEGGKLWVWDVPRFLTGGTLADITDLAHGWGLIPSSERTHLSSERRLAALGPSEKTLFSGTGGGDRLRFTVHSSNDWLDVYVSVADSALVGALVAVTVNGARMGEPVTLKPCVGEQASEGRLVLAAKGRTHRLAMDGPAGEVSIRLARRDLRAEAPEIARRWRIWGDREGGVRWMLGVELAEQETSDGSVGKGNEGTPPPARSPDRQRIGRRLSGAIEGRRVPSPGHYAPVVACAVDWAGNRVLSASLDGTLRFWDLETGEVLQELVGHSGAVYACALDATGTRALSSAGDKTLRLWDLESGETIMILEGHRRSVRACALDPAGKHALSGSRDCTLRLWNVETGETLQVLDGHRDCVTACALDPSSKFALSGSVDETLRLWSFESGATVRVMTKRTPIYACAVDWATSRALSASYNGLVVWDLEASEAVEYEPGWSGSFMSREEEPSVSCAFDPARNRALSASGDGCLSLWEIGVGQREVLRRGVRSCALDPSGRRALSGLEDGTLELWDLDRRETARTFGRSSTGRARGRGR